MQCEFKECKSGKPATIGVNEHVGDGSWLSTVRICPVCAHVLGLANGGEIPEDAEFVSWCLSKHYEVLREAGGDEP